MTRRRLTPDERRRQLLAVGAELFAAQPYEAVLMDEVATRAGVSRALLYKHFPTKRDLFAAVYRHAADGLLDAVALDPDVALLDQMIAGLDAHLDYFEANSNAVLAANRTLAGDPTIQAVIEGELGALRHRAIAASGLTGRRRAVFAAVLAGWLVFVRVLVVDWLADRALRRADVRAISVGALRGALGDLLPMVERPPRRKSGNVRRPPANN